MSPDRFFSKNELSETVTTPYATQAAENANIDFVDKMVVYQRPQAKAQEPTHNYLGAAADVANGFVHEALQPANWMAAAVEGGIAGGLFRMAPPALRGVGLVGGIGYGAYSLCENAPKWKENASTVVNESSYRPEDVQKAHVALENLGGGAVDLIAGFKGLQLGAYFPETTTAWRRALGGFLHGELPLNSVSAAARGEVSSLIKNVDWMENPWWLKPKAGTAATRNPTGLKPAAWTHTKSGERFEAAPRKAEAKPVAQPRESGSTATGERARPKAIKLDKPGVEIEETRAPFDAESGNAIPTTEEVGADAGKAVTKRRPRAMKLDKPGVEIRETPDPFDQGDKA